MARVLVVLLLSAALAQAELHVDKVTKFGCHIYLSADTGMWILDVWAKQDPEPEYKRLYSIQHRQDKVMSDCSTWMETIRKLQRRKKK